MSVRSSALLKIAVGVGVAAIAIWLAPGQGTSAGGGSKGWISLIFGPIIILVGLGELLTGQSITSTHTQWDKLPTWLQSIIGVALAVGIVAGIVGMVVMAH